MKKKQEIEAKTETKVIAIDNGIIERQATEIELIAELRKLQQFKEHKLMEIQTKLDEFQEENNCELGVYITRENLGDIIKQILDFFITHTDMTVLRIPSQIKLKD